MPVARALLSAPKLISNDVHDLILLLRCKEPFKYDASPMSVEQQKIEHIYKMLRAMKFADIVRDHEKDEVRTTMAAYDKALRRSARLGAQMSLTQADLMSRYFAARDKDAVAEAKKRVFGGRPTNTADFFYRIVMYLLASLGLLCLAFGGMTKWIG